MPRRWIAVLAFLFVPAGAAAQPLRLPNGVLLVAKPDLPDPRFSETVVLVTQTSEAQRWA